ncbi:hypothetical protein CYMTET_31508 [Cymbomonas tetramitiformis]|uniref:Uncharacterized protein n=1 Tax=Cymbomonas tetramitiformis TaxID=36881 RepID=A0AAE0FGN9_9CHLO|nr:hypothetical protein CYMTET_31508 [Cymbomonas tetramitiformis]
MICSSLSFAFRSKFTSRRSVFSSFKLSSPNNLGSQEQKVVKMAMRARAQRPRLVRELPRGGHSNVIGNGNSPWLLVAVLLGVTLFVFMMGYVRVRLNQEHLKPQHALMMNRKAAMGSRMIPPASLANTLSGTEEVPVVQADGEALANDGSGGGAADGPDDAEEPKVLVPEGDVEAAKADGDGAAEDAEGGSEGATAEEGNASSEEVKTEQENGGDAEANDANQGAEGDPADVQGAEEEGGEEAEVKDDPSGKALQAEPKAIEQPVEPQAAEETGQSDSAKPAEEEAATSADAEGTK